MGLLDRGMAALIRRKSDPDSGSEIGPLPLTYTRGALSVPLTTAWRGGVRYPREFADPGQSLSYGDGDYIIPVAALIGAALSTPQRGDRITDPNVPDPATGQPTVFEVMLPPGENSFRHSDPHGRTLYRVHTKRVS